MRYLQAHRDLRREGKFLLPFYFFCKGQIVPQVLRKRKGPDEEEECKISDISTNPSLYQTWPSTEYRRQQGNRNNSGVCFTNS